MSGFRDPEFDYQLLRAIGVAEYGGSTVGECLAAASMIIDGDTRSWVHVFSALAGRVEARAEACLAAGHARERPGPLPAGLDLPPLRRVLRRDRPGVDVGERPAQPGLLRAAAGLFAPPVEVLSIPFEGGALPGYLVQPRAHTVPDGRALGTLVAMGGFDSSAEELYFQLGAPGAARGWQVVVFDGPGQAGCMRDNPTMTFRPDYEAPVGAVLDHLGARSDTRPDRLALAGLSLGGYFAARAAARHPRVRALVVDTPIVDLYRYMEAFIGPRVFGMHQDIRPADVAGVPADLLPGQTIWGIAAMCRRFGVGSLQEWKAFLDRFRLGAAAADISCPVLALAGEREGPEVLRQADEFVALVRGPATSRRFTVDDGADAHCQANNLRLAAQVVYDWLAELFAVTGA